MCEFSLFLLISVPFFVSHISDLLASADPICSPRHLVCPIETNYAVA